MEENSILFDFESSINFFDPYRFVIKLSPEEVSSQETSQNNHERELYKLDPLEQKNIGTILHENQHYLNFIGTPVGIYDTLIRMSCLTQISFQLKAFLRDRDKLKIPFSENLSGYPVFAGIYNLADAFTSYLFCPCEAESLHSINDITGFKLVDYGCNKLYDATQKTILKNFPMLVISSTKDGGQLPRCVPIGLQTILEGFARLNQDLYFMHVMSPEQYEKGFEERMQAKKCSVYYILYYYAYNYLRGLKAQEIETIVSLSFYFSLICIRPINQWPYDLFGYLGRNGIETYDKVKHFLSNLSHPGYTFLNTLAALKDIAKEAGGISNNSKDIIKLINKVCERIGCRPINFLYKSFSLFLEKTINNFFPLEFETYPFAKYYFQASLELMKQAADNPYDYIYYPWLISIKLNNNFGAMTFRGEGVSNYDERGYAWFLFSDIMQQFFTKRRIFCLEKRLYGINKYCENDGECSVDKTDYPYSKCEDYFIDSINWVIGDVNKLIPA